MVPEFLNTSNIIFQKLKDLEEIVEKMEKYMLAKQNSVLDSSKEKSLDNKIDKLDEQFEKISDAIKNEIVKNEAETKKYKEKNFNPKELEIRTIHTLKHTDLLSKTINRYKSLQIENRNKEKEQLKRALHVTNPSATEEEINKIAESKDLEAFALGSKSSKEMVDNAKARQQNFEQIVIKIEKLTDLINEISNIVSENTKYINDIVINVEDSKQNISQSNKELKSALFAQRNVMFFKRIFFIFIIGGVVIFGFWGYNKFFRNSSNSSNENSNKTNQ